MSADIKKPPVAPKPKFVIHPPVAPKPESLIGNVLQTSKKPKPVIAPKPKVLKSSSFREPRTPSAFNKNASLEELKGNRSESLDFLNCKNGPSGEDHDGPSYIISMCSCNFKCTHKLGNGENLYNTRTVFEQLEKLSLENTEICRQPTPSPKTRWKRDTHDDRGTNANQIVLNSCVLETNAKNAFCRNILSNSCHFKHTDPNKDAQGNGSLCKSQEDLRRVGSDQSLSSSKECTRKVNPSKLNGDVRELQKPGRSPKGGKKTACPTDQDHAGNCKTDNARTTPESVNDARPQEKPSDPSAKVQPVPKPRKLRVACLTRQDCIDSPGDGTSELVYSESRTVESAEPVLKKLTKINVLGESVSYQEEPRGTVNNVNEETISLHGGEGTSLIEVSAGSENSDRQKGCSLAATEISIVEENVDRALNQDQRCSPNLVDREDDSSDPGTGDKRSSFIRCCSLSMSLPKQLKMTYNQHLSATSGFESTTPKKDNELPLKPEGSPRVAPKKPQRHSLPAAGPLKKAASEELVEKRCYVSNGEPNTQAVVNEIRLRHALAKEHSVSASHDLPKRTSEKPVWKLHRPILPFSCSPESLKASSSNEKSTFVTKPRAKSLSSVDMERIDKPNKDPPKKSTFKKLLNMKLSVCIMKSDFQRFLCKGSQSGDGSSDRLSSGEGKAGGLNVSSSSPVGDRKTKPAKAQSADSYSPESQKKRLMDKCQLETSSRHRSGSLGDQPTFLVENPLDQPLNFVTNHCEVEYENVRHYDEIPEYENLPFTLHSDENTCYEWQNSSSVEEYDATVYEMQDPYEGAERRLLYDSRSSEEDPAAELSIVHSDEEVVNSSDDEGSSSDSSKGDLDQLEDRLSKRAGKKTKVYHIAKEIMSSEKVFVDVLKLLHIDFRDAVAHASRQLGKSVIEDRTLNQILYYLPQLYELNRDVLRELEERMANWSDQQKIADIFVTKGPYLKMYSTYIREFEKNIALLDEQCRRNPGFAAVVKAFEMSPRCANLALKHYLLKPVQRIPQYRLLLTDYLKNILEESSDYRDTQAALAVVIEVANHANDIMKQGDNFQKLMQIQYSLNGHHEIVQPGRVFLKEGTLMKLSRKVMQPRMFFLFNDALLYSTPVQSGMYKLNNMLSLAGMKVRKPTQEAYQNELNIESVERSFILSASSATERDGWLEAISQAIEEYTKKRITFNPSKSLEEAEQEQEKEDSPLGTKAPIWIPDTRATMCMICTSEFTLTWRRHHCRACGKIVCQACSANKHSLEYLKNQPERVCDHCYGELLKQDHQCALKTGSPGNHKSPSSALSTVLQNIPSVRKMKKIPAALKEVSASTEDSSMSGYLYRSKGQKKPWKHLWFVIKNKVLYTYAASEDVAALESQPLLGFTVTEVKDESSESRVFQLLHKNTLFYVFKADDQHSTERWLEAFQEATVL